MFRAALHMVISDFKVFIVFVALLSAIKDIFYEILMKNG